MQRFTRGSVVVRGGRYSVVWDDTGVALVLLPVIAPSDPYVNDVLLELSDLIACGTPIEHAVIRPRSSRPTPRDGFERVGEVPGPVMRRVVQGITRRAIEQATVARWAGDKAHRARAREYAEWPAL